MSNRAQNWAWKQRTGTTTSKLVLVKMADNADDRGYCFNSISYVALVCEINERTVQRNIRQLQELKLLTVEPRYAHGRQISNGYRLAMPALESKLDPGKLPPSSSSKPNVNPSPNSLAAPDATPAPYPVSPMGDGNAAQTTKEPSINQPQRGGCLGDLVYPKTFNATESEVALSLLGGIDRVHAQTLLDELAGRILSSGVHAPLRYLASLRRKHDAGTFTPELALRIASDRTRRKANEDASRALLASAPPRIAQKAPSELPKPIRDFLAKHRPDSSREASAHPTEK